MSSPTITKYGNDLEAPVVIPGWTIDIDGYGLVQSQVKFAWSTDYKAAFSSFFYRGAAHPDSYYGTYLKMVKANMQYGKGGVLNITADYIGIDPDINEGEYSNPVVQMTGSSSSEDITHHPNFYKVNCISIAGGTKLAGAPPAAGGFEPSLTANPNRALWTPRVQNTGATNNCQFVAFLPAQKDTEPVNIKAGVKSYYNPHSSLRSTFFIKDQAEALRLASYVGWVNDGTIFKLPDAYKQLATIGYEGTLKYTDEYDALINKSFLCTNCSVEQFGTIYKITVDLMLSGLAGWDPDIYPVQAD
jgi:hypothetical protein